MAGRGIERPPLWAWLVALAAVVFVVAVELVVHARPAPDAGIAEAPTSDAGNALVTDQAGGAGPIVEIISDSYTGGSAQGGNGANAWPRLMATQLAADGFQVAVATQAAGGSGYVARGPSGKSFDDLVKAGRPKVSLYVFFGSRNDPGKQGVQEAAAATLADALRLSPGARLLVIGPPYTNGNPPASFLADRTQVQTATTAAGGTFVDPLAAGWFSGANSALIGKDGVHPTDDGHRYLTGLITPEVERALTAAGVRPAATASATPTSR